MSKLTDIYNENGTIASSEIETIVLADITEFIVLMDSKPLRELMNVSLYEKVLELNPYMITHFFDQDDYYIKKALSIDPEVIQTLKNQKYDFQSIALKKNPRVLSLIKNQYEDLVLEALTTDNTLGEFVTAFNIDIIGIIVRNDKTTFPKFLRMMTSAQIISFLEEFPILAKYVPEQFLINKLNQEELNNAQNSSYAHDLIFFPTPETVALLNINDTEQRQDAIRFKPILIEYIQNPSVFEQIMACALDISCVSLITNPCEFVRNNFMK